MHCGHDDGAACSELRAPSRSYLDRLIYEAAAGTPAAVIVAHRSRAARRIIAGTVPRKAMNMLHTTLIAIHAAAGVACFAAGLACLPLRKPWV